MRIKKMVLTLLGSRLPGSIDSHFDRLRVGRNLTRIRVNQDRDGERLPSPAAANKPQIIEFSHLVLHHSRCVAQFTAVVFIVAGLNGHQGSIGYVVQDDNFKGARQTLI